MKQGIHPEYKEVKIIQTDGSEFVTRMVYSKGDSIRLDIDTKNHPVWAGGSVKARETGRMARFNNRYAGFSKKKESN